MIFNKIFLWSPSINTVSKDPFETLPDDQKFDDIYIENLEEVLDEIRDSGERVVFIWDDIVNQIRSNGQLETKCHKVLMIRRHLCGAGGCRSVIMTTQVYNNKTSAPLRKVASGSSRAGSRTQGHRRRAGQHRQHRHRRRTCFCGKQAI